MKLVSHVSVILPPVDPNLDSRLSDKPPLRDDTRFAAGKIAGFQYAAVAVFLFLISGFWQLQIQNPEHYEELARQNSVKSVPIPAPRGRILDRDGRVIVDNHTSHTLILAREFLKDENIAPIAQGLDLDYEDLMKQVKRFRSRPKYEAITIKDELTPADLAFVQSHHRFFPELVLIDSQRRIYPQDGAFAHLVGYTSQISDEQLSQPEFAKFEPGEVIGQFGIERQYNSLLMGVDGRREVVVDNRGQVREELKNKPAIPGKDLRLTIDMDLQVVAELAMEGKNGAVVALDPRTGEVLAMVSRPAFDPNKFTVRYSSKDWKEIITNPDSPLMNRAIQAQFAPGSTFKPTMAIAGLETGTIDDKFTVSCGGGATFYGHYFKCHDHHGSISLHRGIAQSCDVFFYNVGNKLGIEKIATYANLVGFGQKSGIDLPGEKEGLVPSEKWALRAERRKWYAGETISVSIGQGQLTVTPVQLARAIAGISMGGVWHHPHLVADATKTEQPSVWALNPENVKLVVDGMYGVVNDPGKITGGRARIPGLEVCGKTGSAQLSSNDLVKSGAARGKLDLRDNAWFVGFASRSNPEIVVVALFEHGIHGQFAAPIVRDVIKAYYDKKVRVAALKQQQEGLSALGRMGMPAGGLAPSPNPAGQTPNSAATKPAQPIDAMGVGSGDAAASPEYPRPTQSAPPPPRN
jgi:penicillin-binding protein 2